MPGQSKMWSVFALMVACGQTPPPPEPRVHKALPADAWLSWSSSRLEGRHEVYLQNANGGEVVRLTHGGGQSPRWSPDGRWIAYYHWTTTSVRLIRWDGSDDKLACAGVTQTPSPPHFWRLTDGSLICPTSEVPQFLGRELVFVAVNPDTDALTHIANIRFDPSSFTRDGTWLMGWTHGLFDGGHTAENGTFDTFHSTVLLLPSDPSVIYHVGAGCLSAASPTGPWLYHVSRESETVPDIFHLRVDDLEQRETYGPEVANPDDDWGHEYMPQISNDGEWMVYGASISCHDWFACNYDIFIHALGAEPNERKRLVEDPANDNFPSLFVGVLPQ